MSDVIGYVVYGTILTAITAAAGKAAYQLYRNGQKNREDPIKLKWNEKEQCWC